MSAWVRNVENVDLCGDLRNILGNPVVDSIVGVKNSQAKLPHLKGDTSQQKDLLLIRERRKYLFIYQAIKLR